MSENEAEITQPEVEATEEQPSAETQVEPVAGETAEGPEGEVPAGQEPSTETSEGALAEGEVSAQIQDGRAWYVVHCYSGYENKVQKNLEHRIESMGMQNKIFRVVIPTEEEIEIREGRRRTTRKRVFPGYVLVEMILDEDSWQVVRNTPGVTGFVGSGTKPTPLSEEEVRNILKRMEVEAPKIKVSFRIGQSVRIIDGPFADFMGTVDDMNLEKGKVRVLVSFFGRETPVELDFLQVSKL
ncbi:MAG: transcription termination/antitermination protein NusG [Chloroflexi bacterium]|nr:transcription termination/antitermination protein NusG [Chloroflexota bacterium]